MKFQKRLTALFAALAAAVAFVGCSSGDPASSGWTDTAERPEIQAPEVLGGYIEYPEAPAAKPVADTSKKTSAGGYTAYGAYTLEETAEGMQATYAEVGDWDYIYVSVDDYQSKYGNFRIALETKGAERVAVQAVYWEMYENDLRPVTVYVGGLADGEQYLVAELGEYSCLDSEYQPVAGKPLKEATILGFVVLLDSNPAQTAASDREGTAVFKSFEFLEDGDPALEDKYVVPKVNWSGSAGDAGYTVEAREDGGVRVSYSDIPVYSRVYLPVVNFSADYSEFDITLTTTGVGSYSIGVMFSVESHSNWQPYVDILDVTDVSDGTHTHTVNFDGTSPVDITSWQSVAGEYIKNYNVYQICIWFDSLNQQSGTVYAGEATVDDVTFNRTAVEGCTVGKAWSSTTPSITIGDDVINGGSGTITYSYYTGWYKMSMPVSGYEPKTKLTVRFMSADPVDYFGVVLMAAGSEITLYSGWDKLAPVENSVDATATDANGTVTTVVYDETTGIYTMTFDFTNAKKSIVTGLAFWEKTVTAVGFYLGENNTPASEWSGTRSVKFISVAFSD